MTHPLHQVLLLKYSHLTRKGTLGLPYVATLLALEGLHQSGRQRCDTLKTSQCY